MTSPDPQERLARGALLLLLALLLVAALVSPFQSAWLPDDRTYLEMIHGVARHGLPWTENGDAGQFPALRARWNVPLRGVLVASYAPLYAYIGAPGFLLDGARGVIRENFFFLGVIALATYAITRRLTNAPVAAAGAAWLVVLATPLPLLAMVATPYSAMVALMALGAWSLQVALSAHGLRSRVFSALAGLALTSAMGNHFLGVPMVLMGLVVLFVGPLDPAVPLKTRAHDGALRLVAGLAGAAPMLFFLGWVNHHRFGTWSPAYITSCPWSICQQFSTPSMRTALLRVIPVALWLVVGGVAAWRLRRRGPLALVGIVAAMLLALLHPGLRERVSGMAVYLTALWVDTTPFDFGEVYTRPPDGLGHISGYGVIKSLFQCSPFLILAFFVRPKVLAGAAGLPVVALFAAHFMALSLRGFGTLGHELGWPYLHMRYNNPALPFLVAMAVTRARELPWRRAHLLTGVAVFILLGWVFQDLHDFGFLRRFVLLRGTLFITGSIAFLLVLGAARVERLPGALPHLASVAFALALAITTLADARSFGHLRRENDEFLLTVARATTRAPAAFLGEPWALDPVIPLRFERDIQYGDLSEDRDPGRLGRLIHRWRSEGREVYLIMPGPRVVESPWPEYRAVSEHPGSGVHHLVDAPR